MELFKSLYDQEFIRKQILPLFKWGALKIRSAIPLHKTHFLGATRQVHPGALTCKIKAGIMEFLKLEAKASKSQVCVSLPSK